MVASAAIMAGGAIASGILSQQGNAASAAESVKKQKELMRLQAKLNYNYSQKDLKNKYIANREGLENAGYNPMLMYSQGVTSNPSWTGAQSAADSRSGSSFNEGVSNALSSAQAGENIDLTRAQTNKTNAEAITEQFKQMHLQIDSMKKDAERILTSQHSNNFDRAQAREDLKTLTDYEHMVNDYNLGVQSLSIQQQVADNNYSLGLGNIGVQQIANRNNAKDIEYRNANAIESNNIARAGLPPRWATAVGGILGTSVGAGLGVYTAVKGGRKSRISRRRVR